jgi:hypothetical protein
MIGQPPGVSATPSTTLEAKPPSDLHVLCALGGIRTPNLLIRSSGWTVFRG